MFIQKCQSCQTSLPSLKSVSEQLLGETKLQANSINEYVKELKNFWCDRDYHVRIQHLAEGGKSRARL